MLSRLTVLSFKIMTKTTFKEVTDISDRNIFTDTFLCFRVIFFYQTLYIFYFWNKNLLDRRMSIVA